MWGNFTAVQGGDAQPGQATGDNPDMQKKTRPGNAGSSCEFQVAQIAMRRKLTAE